jgi:hypothetical protein
MKTLERQPEKCTFLNFECLFSEYGRMVDKVVESLAYSTGKGRHGRQKSYHALAFMSRPGLTATRLPH